MPDKWHTLPFSRAIPANVAPVVTKRQSRMATAHTYESALICEFGELFVPQERDIPATGLSKGTQYRLKWHQAAFQVDHNCLQ